MPTAPRPSTAAARGDVICAPGMLANTRAHAATKQVIRDFRQGGIELANDRMGRVAGELFDTEDLRGAVRTFLEQGPGQATFSGR